MVGEGAQSGIWVRAGVRTPWLGVCAVVGWGNEMEAEPVRREGGEEQEPVEGEADGEYVCLAVTNLHETRDFEVELDIAGIKGKEMQMFCVGGDGAGATNSFEKVAEVRVEERMVRVAEDDGGKNVFTFPMLSLTMLRWRMS